MPICYIDDVGFHRLTLDQLVTFITAQYQGIFGADKNLDPETLDGQWIGTLANDWDVILSTMEAVYNARSPSGATGAGLARLVKINGLTKNDPVFSTVTLTLGTNGTTPVPVGAGAKVASDLDPTAIFVTQANVTIPGSSTVDVAAQPAAPGPVSGPAGHLTKILTIINGWDTCTNAVDASVGNSGETDPQLRTRRTASVALPSQGIVDGLEAALLQVAGVSQAIVRENDLDTTATLPDGGPLAPHAIQCIVKDGADADVAAAIWAKRSLGCTMVGLTTIAVIDVQGTSHNVNFDRPTDVPIYVRIVTSSALTTYQKTVIQAAIQAMGDGQLVIGDLSIPAPKIGVNASASDVMDAITSVRATSIPGLKVEEIDISASPSPTTDTDVAIAYDQIATWLSGNVTFSP
jgi:uncharacterized phage protein gp47/JayE